MMSVYNIFRKYFYKVTKVNNFVEVAYKVGLIRTLAGASVIGPNIDAQGGLVSKFSFVGLGFFLFWYGTYFFCTVKSYYEDQTILRSYYQTKLKHYGDDIERISSLVFALYAMGKISFHLGGSTDYLQDIINIDKEIENMGETIDYSKYMYSVFTSSLAQVLAGLIRLFSIWLTLSNLNMVMPIERIFESVYSDALALIITVYYIGYVILLKKRYAIINRVLRQIIKKKSWEFKILVRDKQSNNMNKAMQLQEKYICEKIKKCARIYSMLYKTSATANKMFGMALVLTMLLCLIFIVLNMFYFMEATASGLYHDVQRYVDFLIYLFWHITYALGIIILNIHFSEATVSEAKKTSYVIHDIINSDIGPSVTKEAMQLSMQLLHQIPKFTAHGLYNLDYVFLLAGARTVTTFLALLLQFATDAY